jgi:hypothetical protein
MYCGNCAHSSTQLLRTLQRQGFEVERLGSGHWRVSRGAAESVVMSGTATSRHAFQRTLKLLRGIGAEV